jgi:hypothetical protein
MNWDYIAGFFDGEGNLHINRSNINVNGSPNYAILVRIYNSSYEVLQEIKNFIGFGNIYKKLNGVFELTFCKKSDVNSFLTSINGKSILKKEQIDYLMKNYDFSVGKTNNKFNLEKFRSFISRRNSDRFRKLKNNTE